MNNLNSIKALIAFISNTIASSRSERYITILKSSKRYNEFINYLYHDFEKHVKENVIISESNFKCWHLPAYTFNITRNGDFGEPFESIEKAIRKVESDGWLIISQNGKSGIFRPEAPSNEIYISF